MYQSRTGTRANPMHARTIQRYVSLIVENSGFNSRDVGVIAPYEVQVRLLRALLEPLGVPPDQVHVLTTDSSQAKEYPVVFFDTVAPGGDYSLGFVSDARRMNVSLTHAKYGLFVMSNRGIGRVQYQERRRRLVEMHEQRNAVMRDVQDAAQGASLMAHRFGTEFHPEV